MFGMKGQNWVRLAKNTPTRLILSCTFTIHNLKREISCHCLAIGREHSSALPNGSGDGFRSQPGSARLAR